MDFLRLLGKYRFFRYTPADPLEACQYITNRIDNFNRGMGVSFFKHNHSFIKFFFIFGISCLVVYTASVLLSVYWFRHEITKVIFCMATFGFGCQAIMKIYSFIITRRHVLHLYMKNVKYYQDMLNQSDRVNQVLCENASLAYVLIKVTAIIYLILVIITMTLPGLSSMFLSSRILPFGFVLPLLNADTWTGYVWNYTFQVFCAYYYWMITVGSDITTIFNLLTAYGQLDVLMVLIDECNEQLARDEPLEAVRSKIVEIIQLHQHHRAYLQELVDFLNPYHFVTVGSTVPTMVISVLGVELIDALTEKVGAIHWHKLSVRDMKHMNMVLAMAQRPKMLLVATTPLNVTAYLKIHKFIYSMIMMLENTKE
uniref:Uncharacterized protein n=1 Tax=Anopheles atroparvus TaxID=41427 RepID=A0A182JI56_ANOAO